MTIDHAKFADRRSVVNAALSEIGTKFHHQGRGSKVGLDCSGLCVIVADHVGESVRDGDRSDYSRIPNHQDFVEAIRGSLTEIPIDEAGIGDWLVFWISRRTEAVYRYPQHMAMITDINPVRIVHAVSERKKVVENKLVDVAYGKHRWHEMITHAFRYPWLSPATDTIGPYLRELE